MVITITSIKSFSEIEIVPNSLIVLDIDETLLTYSTGASADLIMLDHVNLNNFLKAAKKEKCKVIFLTARMKSTQDETIDELKRIGIRAKVENLYHSIHKGEELCRIVITKDTEIEKIIFVDDFFANLQSVERCFSTGMERYIVNMYWINHDFVAH